MGTETGDVKILGSLAEEGSNYRGAATGPLDPKVLPIVEPLAQIMSLLKSYSMHVSS